jgi:DNA-binding response OmpR family regulator
VTAVNSPNQNGPANPGNGQQGVPNKLKKDCHGSPTKHNSNMNNKVLFVDDDRDILNLIRLLLEREGFVVLTADNPTAALHVSEGLSLGVIILDINLAGESGLMLMNFMQHNHKGVPIILYSGGSHPQDSVDKMLRLGAVKYVQKHNGTELVEAVKQMCSLETKPPASGS